jgi:hypothetical protein
VRALPAIAGVAGLVAVGLWLYGPTLSLGFAYDDIDYLNLVGEALSGRVSLGRVLLTPHLEHLLPGVVALFLGTVKLFGPIAAPIRWLVLAAHLATAWLLGRNARRYGGPIAAWVVPFAYVVPCGFSSMWIWQPNGSGVPLAELFFALALLAIARSQEIGPRRARWAAALALALGLAFEATLAPLVLGPALLDELERRRRGTAGRPVGSFTVVCAGVAALSRFFYHLTYGGRLDVNLPQGLKRAAFLVLSAPFRFFFPGVPLGATEGGGPTATRACLYGLALGVALAVLLTWLWRRGIPRLARVAALQAAGPLGLLGLVGIGRWHSNFRELYDADRYFFTLLIPISLLAGATAESLAERFSARRRALSWVAWGAVAVLAAGTAFWAGAHRTAMLRRIPFGVYAVQAERLGRLERLAAGVRASLYQVAPGTGAVRIPDDSFWLPGLHNGRISTRLFVTGFVRDPRFALGTERVDERSAAFLNPILAAWGRETGAPEPYLSIRHGRLYDAAVRGIDFRDGAHDEQVISGFYPWEENARWLGARGELRLTLLSPLLSLALRFPRNRLMALDPNWRTAALSVRLVDEQEASAGEAKIVHLSHDGRYTYTLNEEDFGARYGAGRPVRLVLECGRTWRPKDVIPGSTDGREVCAQMVWAGF